MTNVRKIITTHNPKPIGSRYFDWEAVREGYDGDDDPIGLGRTEADAIGDLLAVEAIAAETTDD